MDELDDLLDPGVNEDKSITSNVTGDKLPNANATLTLGILSIVGCVLYILPGLICGIIALSLHGKDKKLYKSDPVRFQASFKNAKAGFVCAIIGTSLSAAYLLFVIVFFLFFATAMSGLGRF